jgi:signal transduction histidine kinase
MPKGKDPDPHSNATAGRRGVSHYYILVLLGILPLLALAVFSYVISSRAVDRLFHAGNDTAALITAEMIEGEASHWVATIRSHAQFPTFVASVAAGDVDEVRRRLAVLVSTHPRLDRAFVTDPQGMLWTDFPVATESMGRYFDDRDWYRGVIERNGAYVSEVYRRAAEPQLLVVAVAVPVRDLQSGNTVGLLVTQIRLGHLAETLRGIEVGDGGHVILLDHTGALVAHPVVDVDNVEYRQYLDVVGDRNGAPRGVPERVDYVDPFSNRPMLASIVAVDVLGHAWSVVAYQPLDRALAASNALAWQLGGAGVLTTLLIGGLIFGLSRENSRRRRLEQILVATNADLEQRVEQRTRDLRQKEDELLQAQKMEAIGRLAGGVAHDFNNLLTVILGSTEMLMERLPADSRDRREVLATHEAAERAASLTRQLLAFSRKQVMRPSLLDVNEVIGRMRSILDRVLRADIDVVWKLAPDLKPVMFDPGHLEQVLMNLVVNARDAMPRGGKLTIQTENVILDENDSADHADVVTGPYVKLAVSDTGTGMDALTRERIFEPFFTTKRAGEGTGLGLSTVYGIVHQGGGYIWVYSEPGHGTTFKVCLPCADQQMPERDVSEPAAEAQVTGCILVVEDEAGVRDLVVRVLNDADFRVLTAANADEARQLFHAHRDDVNLLLTDVVLPLVSGPALAAELRRERSQLKVLYMSGYTDDAIIHQGVLEEGVAFMEKPLRPREVLKQVRDLLAGE